MIFSFGSKLDEKCETKKVAEAYQGLTGLSLGPHNARMLIVDYNLINKYPLSTTFPI